VPNAAQAELHIAGLVVHAAPARAARAAQAIAALPGAEVHAQAANGKLVVTLETATSEAMSERIDRLRHIDGVLSAALVYQCADSLDVMNQELPHAQA
jgi:periplasmic nitrate reductase NapD